MLLVLSFTLLLLLLLLILLGSFQLQFQPTETPLSQDMIKHQTSQHEEVLIQLRISVTHAKIHKLKSLLVS